MLDYKQISINDVPFSLWSVKGGGKLKKLTKMKIKISEIRTQKANVLLTKLCCFGLVCWLSLPFGEGRGGAFCQNIGINGNGALPDASAILDVSAAPSNDKGMLVPRIALTATNVAAPVTAPAISLLVYNTATAGTTPNNVVPSYYYWDGTQWAPLGGGGDDWHITGNAATIDGTNFIGTTDNVPFTMRVNNQISGRITSAGTTSFGYQAGNGMVAPFGTPSTAIGYQALAINTGQSNTAVGYRALASNTLARGSTAVGSLALSNASGISNVAIGSSSGTSITSGTDNVVIGTLADVLTSSGSFNVIIGGSASSSGGNDNVCIGHSSSTTLGVSNAVAIGKSATVNATNKVRLGSTTITVVEGQVAYSFPSDARFKTHVTDNEVKGLEFITKLRPVVYNFDTRKYEEFLQQNTPDSIKQQIFKINAGGYEKSTAIRQTGFIAQEVVQAAKEVGYNFNGVHIPETEQDNYSVSYSLFVVPLVKAVQELNEQNKELRKEIEALKLKIED